MLILIIAFWNRDFSAFNPVELPLIYTDVSISGANWFILSLIQEWIGYSIIVLGLEIYSSKNRGAYALFILIAMCDILLIFNYIINAGPNLSLYGIVWNDILYFVMIPTLIIILLKKLK